MSELFERFNLRDQRTQLTVASVIAGLVIIAAFVALPGSDDDAPEAVDPSFQESSSPLATDASGKPVASSTNRPGRGSATVTGPAGEVLDEDGDVVIGKSEVKIGITYTEDPGQANAAAGFSVAQIDQRRAWEAVVADINKDPPFGRKIVPVWFSQTENDVTSKGLDRIGQEACARFTQDTKVFMVWVGTIGAGSNTLFSCLTKKKVPAIAFGVGGSSRKTFADFKYLVEPTSAAMDRMAEFYVDELFDARFFSGFKSNSAPYTPAKPADGKPRIGLIRYDEPSHKAGAASLKKRLAAHGLGLCRGCEFEIGYSPDDVQEQLDDATEINAAIQNCKSAPDGPCTHMLFLGNAAQRIPVFFTDGAERQFYRPRIGFSPIDSWTFTRDFLSGSTDAQFRESMIVTWDPAEFGQRTESFGRCKKLIQDAGESFSDEEAAQKELAITAYCDIAAYYEAAMSATGPTLNLDTWIDGVNQMKPMSSAGTYRIQTKSGRHDGIGAIRLGTWSDACTCFKTASGIIPV